MAERTDQRTRERDADLDPTLDDAGVQTEFGSDFGATREESTNEADSGGGIRSRMSERLGSIFSVEAFAVTLVLTVVFSFLASGLIPLVPDNIGGLLGVFGAGFALGAASSERHYLEVATATLFTGAITALLSNLTLTLLGAGVPLVALGAGASGLAGVAGYYFGRDFRSGLTREI
jgi:hypothetical protein